MIHIERPERDGFGLCGAAMGAPRGEAATCATCRLRELRRRQEEDERLAGPEAIRDTRLPGPLAVQLALGRVARRLGLRRGE